MLVVLGAPSGAAEQAARSVLLLRPSEIGATSPAFREAASAFRAALMAGPPARVYPESLDFTYFRGERYESAIKAYLREKYRDVRFDVIVTFGLSPFGFARQTGSEQWPGVPIVFAAVDEESAGQGPGTSERSFTGRTLQLSLAKSVEAARALVPDLKQIALIGDHLEMQTVRRSFIDELPKLARDVPIADLSGRPLVEVKNAVAALPENSAIIYTTASGDGAGRDLFSQEMSEIIASNSTRPIVVDVDNRLGHGGTGGFVVHNEIVGKETAELVLRIFGGETAASIPMTPSNAVKPTFDWRELQRLHISEDRLPPNSIVLFREPTIWEQYRWRVVLAFAAVGLQTALILGLFYEDRRRRIAEDDAHSLLAALEHRNRFAAAGELTASIAHEIRQPLTSIVVAAQAGLNWLTRRSPDLEEVRSCLDNIVKEGHRADDVIQNVRAVFRNDTQQPTPININALVEEVLGLAGRMIQGSDIDVRTAYAAKPIVLGNPVQLRQVLMNLITNAVEAMSTQTSGNRRLQLRTETDSDHASIVVQDSGPGISPEHRDNIFKPFFSTKPGGMGLGLGICKSVMDAHGGSLTMTPGDPTGTIFTIVLPLDKGGGL